MRHRTNPRFWKCYDALPTDIQNLADRCYEVLKSDASHPSLQFKKIGRYWTARVGLHYRAIGIEDEEDIIWFWIGPHSDYDEIANRLRGT